MKTNKIQGCPLGMNEDSKKQVAPPPKAAMQACRLPHLDPMRAHTAVARIAAKDPVG